MSEPQNSPKVTQKSPPREAPETLAAETTAPRVGARPAGPRSRIGRFQIQRVLGEGAFGCVYLAVDSDLARQVAIKVPRAEALTPLLRDRFLREARATATIHHPNVCPVYEVGTDGDVPYLVMHYVAGGTLAGHLAAHKVLAPRPAVALAHRLALGVAAAHEKGVIHRDLKPQNILFDPAKMLAVITDFGLAILASEARMTADGAVCGTPAYMSPEQARGNVDAIGPLSDVYALGVILFQLLTGDVPFRGTVLEVLTQHWEAPPPPPSRVRPGLDPRVDAIVLKALAKKPGDRYPSAKAFAEVLDDYQRLGGVAVPPPVPAPTGVRKPLAPAPAPAARTLSPRPALPVRSVAAPPATAPRPAAPPPARRAAPPPIPRRPAAPALDLPEDAPRPSPKLKRRRLNRGLLLVASVLLLVAVALGVRAVMKPGAASRQADAEAASAAGKSAGDLYVMKFGDPQQEMRFRWIPAGSFRMGSDDSTDETPVHTVTISKGFWMAETETTQAQWKAVMRANPSQVQGENLPVESMSWTAAQEFCRKLAAASGKPVSLPTEAQWEYACRAGKSTRYHSGDGAADLKRAGWCTENSDNQIHPVGTKEANAWGLFDTHGNVWEWCLDGKRQYNFGDQTDPHGAPLVAPGEPSGPAPVVAPVRDGPESIAVVRGGSYRSHRATAAYRYSWAVGSTDPDTGFRVCFRPE